MSSINLWIDASIPAATGTHRADLLARVAFTLPSDYNSYLRELKIGVTGYWGKQNLYTTDAAKTLQGKGVKNRYGIDVYYNHWPFGFTYDGDRAAVADAFSIRPAKPSMPTPTRSLLPNAFSATSIIAFR